MRAQKYYLREHDEPEEVQNPGEDEQYHDEAHLELRQLLIDQLYQEAEAHAELLYVVII